MLNPYWMTALSEITDAAENGKITIYGLKGSEGLHEGIPATYWRTAWINIADVVRETPVIRTKPKPNFDHVPTYSDLVLNANEVHRRWPKAGRLYRAWSKLKAS